MADTALILGLAGIGGTLLAAGAGHVSAAKIEAMRHKREERAERKDQRKASRLVLAELLASKAALQASTRRREWWPDDLAPADVTWREHRAPLADGLDHAAFLDVANAYEHLRSEAADRRTRASTAMSENDVQGLETTLAQLEAALAVLTRFSAEIDVKDR